MITYLIEVSICWLLFYGIYMLLLSKETFFHINRWYLLSALGLGLAIPLFTVDFTSFFYAEPTSTVVYLAESFSELEYVIADSVEKAEEVEYSWLTFVKAIYFLGVFAAFAKFLYGFRQIYSLYRTGTVTQKGRYKLVVTEQPHLPFSFFNYLFWHKDTALEDTDSGKIITHELAHINQWHSLDVLFLETLGILLWFSPPIYWYKKSLRAVHEFLADAYVLRDTKKKQYGHLLIRQVQSGMQISLANNFIHSQLKQRINMMTRNQSRRKELMRYLPALPLLLLMVLVFSNKNVRHNINETTAMASLAFEELSPNLLTALIDTEDTRFFTPEEIRQKLVDAYNKKISFNFTGVTPAEEEVKKMEDSGKMKNLHKACKALIEKYPDNEANIKALMKEVALENGYSVRFNGENIIYHSIDPTDQQAAAEMFKLLVVNGASVGNTKPIIPSSEIQTMETLSPEQAVERFGEENGKNGAVLITSDAWTVLEAKDGATILVRKDAADMYDDGNHTIKVPDGMEKDKAFTDTPPIFPGGKEEMLRFIYRNIKYPAQARAKGIYGSVKMQFVVEEDGAISNLQALGDVGGGIQEEILRIGRLIKNFPQKWTPAKKDGVAIRTVYELPIEYRLEGENADGTSFTMKKKEGPKKENAIVVVGYYKENSGLTQQPDPVFKEVDEMPRFPGCEGEEMPEKALTDCAQKEMLTFIYSNIKYPEQAKKQGIEGTVVVKFVVDKHGKITTSELVRGIGGRTGEEVLRVVGEMPTWIPGQKDGKAVNVFYHLPVKFKLAPDAKKEVTAKKKGKVPTHTTSGEKIFKIADQMPLYPGCDATTGYSETLRDCANQKMLEFIYQNVKYPEAARKEGIEGVVVIRFLVEKDGTISDAEILRNVGGGTGEEALRVVNLMREQNIKWIPGQQDGEKVNVNFNLPVKFKLAGEVKEEIKNAENKENVIYHPTAPQIPIGYKDEAITFDAITLNVFPNPAKDQLSITLQGKAKNVLVTVFDITGKEFFREKINAFDGTSHKTIDLQNVAKGTLIVNVRHKGKDYQKKVIVQ